MMGHPNGNPFTLAMARQEACRALRLDKHLQTPEDWAPSIRLPGHKGRFLRASLVVWPEGGAKVSVWGSDDFGMEREFPDLEQARQAYRILPNPCTVEALKLLGYGPG